MQFGAFVITYNRPRILSVTLQAILQQSNPPSSVLVIDNGNTEATKAAALVLGDPRISYHAMPENIGPAGAAAYGLRQLSKKGCDWIYWGDDDDPPQTPDTFAQLLHLADQAPKDVAGVGAVGTRWNWELGQIERLPDEALHGILEVDTIAGSSQLILHRQVVALVGLPDQRLFFGFEEPEYCLRIRRAGLRLLVDGDLMRQYRMAANRMNLPPKKRWQLSRSYTTLWRQYYSTRNYIFVMRNTFSRPDLARREACKAIGRSVLGWRKGIRYGSLLTYLQARSVFDGYLGIVGCTVLAKTKIANTNL